LTQKQPNKQKRRQKNRLNKKKHKNLKILEQNKSNTKKIKNTEIQTQQCGTQNRPNMVKKQYTYMLEIMQ
jgi:hypothetical protein